MIVTRNLLKSSRAYLAGPIEYVEDDGVGWRDDMTLWLKYHDIIVIDPCKKAFQLLEPNEVGEEKVRVQRLRSEKRWREVAEYSKRVRAVDLRMVDISDFIIAYVNPDVRSVGTLEEIFTANRQKKPILIIHEGGIENASTWLIGIVGPQCIFGNMDAVKGYLGRIDAGDVEMDERWKILNLGLEN